MTLNLKSQGPGPFILVDALTNEPVQAGTERKTFRGEVVTVTGWDTHGRNRVYCKDETGRSYEWFTSVIGCNLVEGDYIPW